MSNPTRLVHPSGSVHFYAESRCSLAFENAMLLPERWCVIAVIGSRGRRHENALLDNTGCRTVATVCALGLGTPTFSFIALINSPGAADRSEWIF